MIRLLVAIPALAAAAASTACALAATSARAPAMAQSFQPKRASIVDPVGDPRADAQGRRPPDILGVDVANDAAGMLTFTVKLDRAGLRLGEWVAVAVGAGYGCAGADFVLEAERRGQAERPVSFAFARCAGGSRVYMPVPSFAGRVDEARGEIVLSVSALHLRAMRLDVAVESWWSPDEAGNPAFSDRAPDAGSFRFELRGTLPLAEQRGTQRNDVLVGTHGPDRILGLGGNDTIRGLDGADELVGGSGRDRILGGAGDDLIRARDGERDVIDCGPGRDRVVADRIDDVARNCERVERR